MTRETNERRRSIQRRIRESTDDIAALRLEGTPSRDDVERIAKRLGRKWDKGRGSEPAYKNEWFPHLRTLLIPNKSPLKKGTAHKILSQLEGDLAAMRSRLERLGGPIDEEPNA